MEAFFDGPSTSSSEDESGRVKTLEQEVMDLKIVNRGNDYFIEQLKSEREGIAKGFRRP